MGTVANRAGARSGSKVLVADIGSTNARFAIATLDGELSDVQYYRLAEFDAAETLVDRYLADLGNRDVQAACLALAGPSQNGRVTLSNAPLTFDAARLAARTGLDDVRLINDFAAVAHAVPHLPEERLRPLGGQPPSRGVKAVLGPGTGLGMGVLVPLGDDWQVLPSEGGHAALAPKDPLEAEVVAILLRDLDYASWESVLSGPGLVRLYRAVCELWGCDPEVSEPSEITRRGMALTDPVCHQTLELFCAMLGTAAGSLALTAGARGGVYIAGGIAPKIYDFLGASRFRERFERHGALTGFCRPIGVRVIDDPYVGLRGALYGYLRNQLRPTMGSSAAPS